MRFKVDQDLHVHSFLSVCSRDEVPVPQAILDCAVERGVRQVCLTDHYWDERVPRNTRVNCGMKSKITPMCVQLFLCPKLREWNFYLAVRRIYQPSNNPII